MITEETKERLKTYTPVLDSVVTIKTNVHPFILDFLKHKVENAEGWNFRHGSLDFKNRHAKLYISENSPLENIKTLGFAEALLMTVYTSGGSKYFKPHMLDCGFSIKDEHRIDNIHVDPDMLPNKKCLKVLGILNTNWKQEWGGQFEWNGKKYPMIPGQFLVFDANIPHRACEIYTDEKRIAVDYQVPVI